MNPLSRFLGLSLFFVLMLLAALLATPLWSSHPTTPQAPASTSAPAPSASRFAALSQRVELGLALVGLTLGGALIISLSIRPRSNVSQAPFEAARAEMGALSQLAATAAQQHAALSHERDGRRRAQEDADLKQRLLADSVAEKIRLGRDLHDGIIQSLYAAGLTIESARDLITRDPAEASRRLEECRAALNTTIRDVRDYITGLTPEKVRYGSFMQAVDSLLIELRAGREVRFDVRFDDEAASLLTAPQVAESLHIVREAVSNALRHGRASLITLRMHRSDEELCLMIHDNGSGFDAAKAAKGHGLSNIRARAEQLGAHARVTSLPGEGTRVVVLMPIGSPRLV